MEQSTILEWLRAVILFPFALLYLIFMAILYVTPAIFKAFVFFIIVAVNTPFAVMFNVSLLARSKWSGMEVPKSFLNPQSFLYDMVDPRIYLAIEVKAILYDFFKVVGGGYLLVISTGIITYYTASLVAFYISMAVGVMSVLLTWLNTRCSSKTAFACLCAGYGLNPLMFLFSFMGLFDVGCHPIAKCSFTAKKAFLFADCNEAEFVAFKRPDAELLGTQTINFPWDAFERGLFQFCARIDFIKRGENQFLLKTYMVLSCWNHEILNYPVERLELREGYYEPLRLLHFLHTLNDGFVTDRMRGRYEHSLTLQEIVDGVEKHGGYRVVPSVKSPFLVAGCAD